MSIRQTQDKKTLLLIDGNNLFHRAYHALPSLTDKSGENANAVFGFSNMLIKAIDEVKPAYVACAFDTKAPTFRHVEFEAYKAQRLAPPPDLYPQLPKVKAVLVAFGIKYFEKAGYEADDILASIASKLETRNSKLETVILSGDRDLLQLVDGKIKVQMPSFTKVSEGKPGVWGVLMGSAEVKEKYGVSPEQMVDYKALTGDPSDNVPGVAGVGPKTAADLIQKYGSVEGIFEHLEEVGEKVRVKLEAGRANALSAKKLVKLDTSINLKFKIRELISHKLEIEDLKFDPDRERVVAEFERLGFKSIVSKLTGKVSEVKEGLFSINRKAQVSKVKEKKNESNQLELI